MREFRVLDSPPYTVDGEVLRRFDRRKTAFALCPRSGGGRHAPAGHAETIAWIARLVHDRFGEIFESEDAGADRPAGPDPAGADPHANAAAVKDAARQFGAELVGICRLNPAWLYAGDDDGGTADPGEPWPSAVVMATAMDVDAIRTSPDAPAATATQLGYMRMAVHAHCVARFLRDLGHRAVACCNDTALSVPLAIDAGLGEMGRNGCLLTPEYGPCVRICKVLTDMPLAPDRPIELGAAEACGQCRRCAEACPVGAISDAPEPSFQTVCPANNPGVLRWPVDALKCLAFWRRIGRSCSTCIAACPFTGPA